MREQRTGNLAADELQARLKRLEDEAASVRAQLVREGVEEEAPALFLALKAGGTLAVIRSDDVREILRLVGCTPLPESPPHVLGTFLFRGEPLPACSLSMLLGAAAAPALDAHMIILERSRPMALVVDEVQGLIEATPQLSPEGLTAELMPVWRSSPLLRGIARRGAELWPILDLDAIARRGAL